MRPSVSYCNICGGDGFIDQPYDNRVTGNQSTTKCPGCDGSGKVKRIDSRFVDLGAKLFAVSGWVRSKPVVFWEWAESTTEAEEIVSDKLAGLGLAWELIHSSPAADVAVR